MRQYNPDKKIHIEIHLNCPSMTKGYTVWHMVGGERERAISRNADGKDFDWMNDQQIKIFENGGYKFTMTAADASEYFNYLY